MVSCCNLCSGFVSQAIINTKPPAPHSPPKPGTYVQHELGNLQLHADEACPCAWDAVGGQFVATAHFMQRCRLPRLCLAHQIQTKEGRHHTSREEARGSIEGRSVEKHTFPGGQEGGLLISRPNILPANGRPSELDAVCVIESLLQWGPGELYSVSIAPDVGA